ncbi:MAG: hypothetical protein ACKVVT_08070 [Dehalococcoidia bacterium]
MISGQVGDNKRASVDAQVWVPTLGARVDVRLRIDLGADVTSVSFSDLGLDAPPAVPLDDAALVQVEGARVVPGTSSRALIRFTHDEGATYTAMVDLVLLGGPEGHARLGLDVLGSMVLVYDPGSAAAFLEPVT